MKESNLTSFEICHQFAIFKNIFLQLSWTFTKYIDFID